MALLRATLSLLPHTVMAVPTPLLLSSVGTPARYSYLLGPDSVPHPCSLQLLSSLSHFTILSTVLLLLPCPLLLTNFFFFFPSFLCFLLFHTDSFSALPVLLRHFSCPIVPRFSTQRLHPPPPSNFQCYCTVHCSHLLPLLVFPCPSVRIIMFLGLPALHVVILPWGSAGLWLLPQPTDLLLFSIYYHILQ
jgi:hypothetical protein